MNVALRKELDLYARARPCKSYPGVRSRYANVDLIVVRENTEDLYAGIEFEQGTPDADGLLDWLAAKGYPLPTRTPGSRSSRSHVTGRSASSSSRSSTRARTAAASVTAVHKANIMKFSDGLFLQVARDVAEEYTDIEFKDRIVDNLWMQLVQSPEEYDVLVLPNLYGDIISDLCAGLIGGLGVAPGANIGDGVAVFEPTHGSAPKYTGQNKVNPMAMMFSGVLMLRHLGEGAAADAPRARDRRGHRRGQTGSPTT